MRFIYKTKSTSKRITAALLLLIMVMSCSGCSQITDLISDDDHFVDYENFIYSYDNEEDNTSLQTDIVSTRTRYKAETIELGTETPIVRYLMTTSGNSLYYITTEVNSSDNSELYTIWRENFDDGHSTEQVVQLPTNDEMKLLI